MSPVFELQEIKNQRNNCVQTCGNKSTHLKSDYADVLAVKYHSDEKTLDATFWLGSFWKMLLLIINSLRRLATYSRCKKGVGYYSG